jgi:hypothetical protein
VIAEVVVDDHLVEETGDAGKGVGDRVGDSEEIVETPIEEMTGEEAEAVAELATIAIGLDTWQEIALNQTVEKDAEEEEEVVDLVAEGVATAVVEAEHAIIAIEKDIWPEIAQRETGEIEEDDNF